MVEFIWIFPFFYNYKNLLNKRRYLTTFPTFIFFWGETVYEFIKVNRKSNIKKIDCLLRYYTKLCVGIVEFPSSTINFVWKQV